MSCCVLPSVILPVRIAGVLKKNILKTIRICGKILTWIRFFADGHTRRTIAMLIRKGTKLIKHVFPKEIRGDVTFGFDDPYNTGIANAACSALYPVWERKFSLTPDFSGKVLEGEASVRGRIVVAYVLWILLSAIFNRDFRYVRNYLKSQKEGNADG